MLRVLRLLTPQELLPVVIIFIHLEKKASVKPVVTNGKFVGSVFKYLIDYIILMVS